VKEDDAEADEADDDDDGCVVGPLDVGLVGVEAEKSRDGSTALLDCAVSSRRRGKRANHASRECSSANAAKSSLPLGCEFAISSKEHVARAGAPAAVLPLHEDVIDKVVEAEEIAEEGAVAVAVVVDDDVSER